MSQVAALLARVRKPGASSGAAWGGITGDIASQTDLAALLATIPKVGQVVVTVPALAYEHEQTVSATGLTGSMRAVVSVAPHVDADENHETMLDVASIAAEPGTNNLTVRLAFGEPTSGPIRINYMAA